MIKAKQIINDGSSVDEKEDAVARSSSISESFLKFNLDGMPSLLPAKPDTSSGEKIDDGSKNSQNSNNCYVYPVDAFPPLSAFDLSTEFPALILPARRTHEMRTKLKSIMLSRPRLPVVLKLSDSDLDDNTNENGLIDNESSPTDKTLTLSQKNRNKYRKIILDPQKAGLNNNNNKESSGHNPNTNATLHHDLKSFLDEEPQSFRLGCHTIVLSYQDWTAEEILGRLLLPEGVKEVPSAFEAVGHLAHVNLRDKLLPYKYLVGKVLLDKNSPRIRTVVNKLGSIDNKYRTFGMEVIAGNDKSKVGQDGESWSDVLVKEEGCEYRLDFRKVYWNSRLGGEHRRLVKLIKKDAAARTQSKPAEHNDGGDTNGKGVPDTPKTSLVVADLMAGIGPFAIPLTAGTRGSNNSKKVDRGDTKKKNKKKGNVTNMKPPLPIEVYANDLNPSSYEYLVVNAKRNKCDFITNDDSMDLNNKDIKHKLYGYNMDARAFCHRMQDRGIFPDHCIMNLPATALEFLDAFRGYPSSRNGDENKNYRGDNLPRIHVHCFAPKDTQEARQEIWKRAETSLGCSLDENDDKVVIHPVRDVAPNKNMYCISFQLPSAVSALSRIKIDIKHQDQHKQEERMEKEVVEPDSKKRKTGE